MCIRDSPNGILQTSLVTNYSSEDIRRVIWTFSIAYGDDFNKAKSLLLKWIKEDERILDDMEPMVVISELADSSVNIMVRVWVKSENFLNVKFDYNEKRIIVALKGLKLGYIVVSLL